MTPQRFELTTAPLGEGTVLLEASAGTGKTYTLTGILLRLLLEGSIERLDQALVVTFTIAATDELKNRLRRGLIEALAVCEGTPSQDPFFAGLGRHGAKGAKILRTALDNFDQIAVATMHGFCKRLLDEAAFESHEPFQLEFAVDEVPLWQAAAEDALRLVRANDSLMLGAVLQEAGFDPDALVALFRLWQRHADVQLDPSQPQTGLWVANLRGAVHGAAVLWDEAVQERIVNFAWLSGKRLFPNDPAFALAQLQTTLATTPELALELLCKLSPTSLSKALTKRPPQRLDLPFFAACDSVLAARDQALAHLRGDLLLRMQERLERHKRTDGILSFQDLLSRTHAALHDANRREPLLQSVRQRYQVALIDEFQDTDSLQYGIFSTCFKNRPLFLVGDPKQSIYGFRGADLHTYLAARDEAVREATLEVNFRSSLELVAATGQLFAGKQAFVEPAIRMPPVRAAAAAGTLQVTGDPGPALQWRFVPPPAEQLLLPGDLAEACIADDVAAEISRLLRSQLRLDARPLRPRDIAILTRTNRQATTIQTTLRSAGIVSAIGKAGDVFDTEELIELERLLYAILLPADAQRARAAMSTRLWGHDAASLRRLETDEAGLDEPIANLERWRQLWWRSGFVVMKEQLLQDLGSERQLLAIAGGERRLTNFQQLFEMLHEAEHEHRLTPEGLLQWLQEEHRHQDEIDYQRRELRLESDDDAVQILTVHGSKGLQYEIVFCPFLWDGRAAPRKSAILRRDGGRRLEFEISDTDTGWLDSEAERLAEDVRLCYVAVTRARRRCYVHWGAMGSNQRGAWCSALGWLLRPNAPDMSTPSWPKAWADAYKKESPLFGDQLRAVVARSRGTMGFAEVPVAPVVVPVPPSQPAARRSARTAARTHRQFGLHSFTSLVAGAAPLEGLRDVTDPSSSPPGLPVPDHLGRGIFGFQRGAEAGQCLHSVLEQVDWQDLTGDATRQLVATTLRQFGLFEADAHPGLTDPLADVMDNLQALAAARVHDDGPTLLALCSQRKIAEWQFTLPTVQAELAALADVFATGGGLAAVYAGRLPALTQRTLRGFLTGFADLIAEHDGRYWVLDWKSNHLGNQLADYGPDAVLPAMLQHDYVLQYHLYVLALHRHLRARRHDYQYEQHFGGVCYAFLRGAAPGTSNGMCFDRPSARLIAAMDDWASGARQPR